MVSAFGPETFIVPFDKNEQFTGRKEFLLALRRMLCEKVQSGWNHRVALYGMGGVGKTQVAIEYIYANREKYDRIYWITATTEATILSGFQEIALRTQCLSSVSIQKADQKLVAKFVLSWLRHQRNWLIVLDNLDNIKLGRDYLPERGPDKHTLISTRNPNACDIPARGLEVPLLDLEDSIEMLCELSEMDCQAHRAPAATVVEELQYLPFALEQAASYVRGVARDFTIFLQDYRRRRPELHGWVGDGNRQYSHSLATVWLASFEYIEREMPVSLKLLQLLSFLNPHNISLDFIVEGKSALESDMEAMMEDSLKFAKALLCLERFSLVKWSREQRTLAIHRLIQAVVKDKMDGLGRKLWASIVVKMCNNVMSKSTSKLLQQTQSQVVVHLLNLGDECPLEGAEVMYRIGRFMEQAGKWTDAENLFSIAVKVLSRLSSIDDIRILEFSSRLGNIKRKLGQLSEAAIVLFRTLNTQRRTLGPNHPDTLKTMNCLSRVYRNQGLLTEAAELYKEVLATQMTSRGKDHPSTLRSMNNLANVYRNQGLLTEAAGLHKEVLERRAGLLGKGNFETLKSMNNLALVYWNQGLLSEAAELHKEALARRTGLLGKQNIETLKSMNNLALVYRDQGLLSEAAELGREALTYEKKLLGNDHLSTLRSMETLGTVYKEMGRLTDAVGLLESAFESLKRVVGDTHVDTIESMIHLAAVYMNQGRLVDCIRLEETVLASSENVLSKNHPLRFEAISDLGIMYLRQGRAADAIELHTIARVKCQQVFGRRHPQTLTLLSNLAEDLSSEARWKDAVASQKIAVSTMQLTYGVDHQFTRTAAKRLEELRTSMAIESSSDLSHCQECELV